MLPGEVQTFCKMYGVVGLHIDCFSWKGCYSESEPPLPALIPAKPKRAHSVLRDRGMRGVDRGSLCILHTPAKI